MSNNIGYILKQAGLKQTAAREAILRVFSKDCEPLRAEDIYKKVRSVADQVTVYRTLNSLEERGIVRKVDLRKDATYYELSEHHHHHIICKQCGKIEGFDICDMNVTTKKILNNSSKFKTITDHSLELFGLCKSCA